MRLTENLSDSKKPLRHLWWIIPLVLGIGFYCGLFVMGHYQQDFFKLGVDAGNKCSHLYNTEYKQYSEVTRNQMYVFCTEDYPDIQNTSTYLMRIKQ